MTTPAAQADPAISAAFISQARYLLREEYLPKIERCLEQLSDEQVWWRANAKSNSIGNLLLHLSGNVRQWIVGGLGGAPDQRNRDAEFAQGFRCGGVARRNRQGYQTQDQNYRAFHYGQPRDSSDRYPAAIKQSRNLLGSEEGRHIGRPLR